jgi:hypothetical protein
MLDVQHALVGSYTAQACIWVQQALFYDARSQPLALVLLSPQYSFRTTPRHVCSAMNTLSQDELHQVESVQSELDVQLASPWFVAAHIVVHPAGFDDPGKLLAGTFLGRSHVLIVAEGGGHGCP